MKLAITVALVSFFGVMALSQQKTSQAPAGNSQMASAVERITREAWQDFKDKKADAYAAILDDDFTAVEPDGQGPHDKKASVAEAQAGGLNSFSLTDFKVVALGPNSAMATYTADSDGAMPDGKIVHSKALVTEIWIKREGKWKSLRYHESELK